WLFLTSTYQAMQNTRTLFFLYLAENGVNIVAAIALYPVLGVKGLGLALALAYAASTAAALRNLGRRIDGLGGRDLVSSLVRISLAAAVMAIAVLAIRLLVGGQSGLGAAVGAGVAMVAGGT